jgi:hypothetical protein
VHRLQRLRRDLPVPRHHHAQGRARTTAEQIARLRKEADVRFASLWGALGASTHARPGVAPEPARATGQVFELRARAAAEPVEKRRGLA